MANSGYSWPDTVSFITYGGDTDWNDTMANASNRLSDVLTMEGTASKIISVFVDTPNSAVADDLTIAIVKKGADGGYQNAELDNDNFRIYPINITQDQETRWNITLYAIDTNDFKVHVFNESGFVLPITISEENSSVTVAS
jgi:hypothetical protein